MVLHWNKQLVGYLLWHEIIGYGQDNVTLNTPNSPSCSKLYCAFIRIGGNAPLLQLLVPHQQEEMVCTNAYHNYSRPQHLCMSRTTHTCILQQQYNI